MTEIRTRLIHGFLDTCLLSLLAEHSDYGMGLGQRLAEAGLDDLPGGTLYPALLRLEKRDWAQVSWQPSASGPPRKYYSITPTGREALAERRTEWDDFVRIVGSVVGQNTPKAL